MCGVVDSGDVGARGGAGEGRGGVDEAEVGGEQGAEGAGLLVEDGGVGAAAVEEEEAGEVHCGARGVGGLWFGEEHCLMYVCVCVGVGVCGCDCRFGGVRGGLGEGGKVLFWIVFV